MAWRLEGGHRRRRGEVGAGEEDARRGGRMAWPGGRTRRGGGWAGGRMPVAWPGGRRQGGGGWAQATGRWAQATVAEVKRAGFSLPPSTTAPRSYKARGGAGLAGVSFSRETPSRRPCFQLAEVAEAAAAAERGRIRSSSAETLSCACRTRIASRTCAHMCVCECVSVRVCARALCVCVVRLCGIIILCVPRGQEREKGKEESESGRERRGNAGTLRK